MAEGLTRDENAQRSYYSLRLSMIALAFMLYAGVLIMRFYYDCHQDSISAYYFTPVRPVLIAALSAIGVGLVVYHGKTRFENVSLDVAGFMAVVVAFVPTGPPTPGTGCNKDESLLGPDILGRLDPGLAGSIESAYVARLAESVNSSIAASVISLIIAAATGLVLSEFLRPNFTRSKPLLSPSRRLSVPISAVLLAVGAVLYFTVEPVTFRQWAHPLAAFTFFGLVVLVMIANAVATKEPTYRNLYWATVAGTALFVVVVALLRDVLAFLFWVETAGILGFTVFWVIQTQELGGFIDRDDKAERLGRGGL